MQVDRSTLQSLVLIGLGLMSAVAWANTGTVSQLSGTLSVHKADGSVRILSQQSEIVGGDTVNTQKDSYAQIKFSDGGVITLKPNTSVKIEQFRFKQEEPEKDSFIFGLVKGGLRAVTGLVGKRGDQDAYNLSTASATIGIRGTSYGADDCLTTPCPKPNSSGNLEPSVYVSVTDGEIIVTNNVGSQSFLAGQFGAISDRNSRPRFLSTDPGLQFTPPATFIQSIMTGAAVNAGKSQECVVRR
ncbi:iron dicitrate transport regulator FecR [Patescibacteria group bacterium]|nr:MAG: iron dicitrate transport regulator FecR [Patescibacteria group bacterium]